MINLGKAKVTKVGEGQHVLDVVISDGLEEAEARMNIGQVIDHLLQRIDNLERFVGGGAY